MVVNGSKAPISTLPFRISPFTLLLMLNGPTARLRRAPGEIATAREDHQLGHLECLRSHELCCVRGWFRPGMEVLDVGGGSGYQASLLDHFGCSVKSVDIAVHDTERQYFEVQIYDGSHFPFEDRRFDVVFSSNVLEHIRDLSNLFRETRRVLKPNGICIHLMPTPAWVFWTQVSYYPHLVRKLFSKGRSGVAPEPPAIREQIVPHLGWQSLFRRMLVGAPHGEYPCAASELYYFSRRRWRRVFRENGFDVDSVSSTNLFYTGNCTFTKMPMTWRRRLARVFGSACAIYVGRPI